MAPLAAAVVRNVGIRAASCVEPFAVNGQHPQAAQVLGEALLRAEPGSAGWPLPVDPLIDVTARPEAWAEALAILRNRAL